MCDKIKPINEFKSVVELILYYKEEKTCLNALEHWIWKGSMRCLYCGTDKVYRFKDGIKFKCSNCKEHFTAKVGTIFEGSKLPMVKWFMAIYYITAHKKGISSHQLGRDLNVTQKTAWFMLQRIREAFKQDDIKLEGVVQSDETFVGGKNGNRHIDKKVKNIRNNSTRIFKDKTTVLGMISDSGKIKTKIIPAARSVYIEKEVLKTVKKGSIWVTDNFMDKKVLKDTYQREVVNHNQKKYYSDNGFTTNAIENVWSHLKRMIIGVYHQVSRKHLQRYCDELTFRFNTRDLNGSERFALLISKVNCRLKYKQLIQSA